MERIVEEHKRYMKETGREIWTLYLKRSPCGRISSASASFSFAIYSLNHAFGCQTIGVRGYEISVEEVADRVLNHIV